jgi:hypothetical protein
VPSPTRLVVKKGSKIFFSWCLGCRSRCPGRSPGSPNSRPQARRPVAAQVLGQRHRLGLDPMLPPSGIASRALTTRLISTCSNCRLSARIGPRTVAALDPCTSAVRPCRPPAGSEDASGPPRTSSRSSTSGFKVCLREKASNCPTSEPPPGSRSAGSAPDRQNRCPRARAAAAAGRNARKSRSAGC